MAGRFSTAVNNNDTGAFNPPSPGPHRDGGSVTYETSVYYQGPDARNIRPIYRPTPSSHSIRRGRSLSSDRSRYSSCSPDRSPSPRRRPRRRRHQSPSYHHNRSPTRSRSRSRSRNRNRTRSHSLSPARYHPRQDPDRPKDKYTLLKAAKCAALGAGLEAFRARNEPGPWLGRKGKRMALAAASGVAVGSIRQGSMHSSGWAPYAEALCTGFFAVEWYKKIGRDTHHEEQAAREQEQWRRERKGSGRG